MREKTKELLTAEKKQADTGKLALAVLEEPERGQSGEKSYFPAPVKIGTATPPDSPLFSNRSGAATINSFQKSYGNLSTLRHFHYSAQAKLNVGQPDDVCEQEADRIAGQVMSIPDSEIQKDPGRQSDNTSLSQRENVQGKGLVQSKTLSKQITPMIPRNDEGLGPAETSGALQEVTPRAVSRIQSLRTGGLPLPESVRSYFAPRFGVGFEAVRVHTGPVAAEATRSVNAKAFTIEKDIVFGEREYAPETDTGRRLLAHELTHTLQSDRELLRRVPDDPPPAPAFKTVSQVLKEDGTSFRPEYPVLQQAYDHYRATAPTPATPERWILLARGANRQLLQQVLGPNLGEEVAPATPGEADIFRLAELQRPADYPPELLQRDLEFLSRYPDQLQARLGSIPPELLAGGELSDYLNIAAGNVGEIFAEPVRQMRLAQLRQQYPNAEILRGVRAQLVEGTNADGSPMLGSPKLFSDDPIAVVEPGLELLSVPGSTPESSGVWRRRSGERLRILWVPEVKAGPHGGQEATGQIHVWIESHLEEGFTIVLQDGRTFRYDPRDPSPGVVTGLAAAPRAIIASRGAEHLGAGGEMAMTSATVERIALQQTPEQMRYLAAVTLQSLAIRFLLQRLQANMRTVYEASTTADFTNIALVRKILTEHGGLAVASGRLYRLRDFGGQLSITEVPVVSLAFVYPPGTTKPSAPLQLGPGLPSTSQPGSPQPPPAALPPAQPQLAPVQPVAPQLVPGAQQQCAPGPPQLPLGLPLPTLRPATELGRGAVPVSTVAQSLPFVSGLGSSEYIIWGDGVARDAEGKPISAYQDGEIWIRVIRPGGTPLPEIDPATGAPAPVARVMTPEGAARLQPTPYEAPGRGGPSTTARVAVGAVGVIMVINELLAPYGSMRQQQQRDIARTQAQIRFYAEFGAEPNWEMREVDANRPLPWSVAPEAGSVWGHKAPRIVSVNVSAFKERLPGRVTDFQSLVLFLDGAKTLGTILQRGPRYFLFDESAEHEITATIEKIRFGTLRTIDEEQRARAATRTGEVFRLRSSSVPIFRYSSGSPIKTSHLMLGSSAWVRPAGTSYRSLLGVTDRVQVEPANAEAQQAALNAWYLLNKDIDAVFREVTAAGREIISREPSEGPVTGFAAGAFPPELGVTRYLPHPEMPNNLTVAIGELRQFWVNRSDLEPVAADDVAAYAGGAANAPAPSKFFQSEDPCGLNKLDPADPLYGYRRTQLIEKC
jgi:uncharacterized protein DUF4157